MIVPIRNSNASFIGERQTRRMLELYVALTFRTKGSKVLGVSVEHLYTMVLEISHDHVALLIHHDTRRSVKLSGIRTLLAYLLNEGAITCQVDEPVVAGICDEIGIVFFSYGDVGGGVELVFTSAQASVHVVRVSVE